MDAQDKKIVGGHNTVSMVNPFRTHFIAHYSSFVVTGNDLFDTGWADLPDGITQLQYQLSTGHVINIPKYRSYLSLIEVSESLEGARVFHSINVKCLGDNEEVTNYKIILKRDQISKYKIGDLLITKDTRIINSPHWKLAA